MTATDVLAQHRIHHSTAREKFFCCGFDCTAEWFDTATDHAAHQLDALGAAGVAVVEPSPPTDLKTINHDIDRHVAGWDVDGGDGRIELRVDIFRRIHMEGMEYTPAEIRVLLPALLAAAITAEANS